jgi:hypothetical protein
MVAETAVDQNADGARHPANSGKTTYTMDPEETSKMTTCQYEHNVSGDRFEEYDADTWHCPHPPHEGREYCVFHCARFEDGDYPVGASALGDAIASAIEAEGRERNRLFGAVLGDIDIDFRILDGSTNHPIDLREARIEGTVQATDAEVRQDLNCDGAVFKQSVMADGITLGADATFTGAEFRDRLDLRSATFEAWAGFDRCTFGGVVNLRLATFTNGVSAIGAEFGGGLDAMNTRFKQVANMADARFTAGALFQSSRLVGGLSLDGANFGDRVAVGADRRENPALSDGEFDLNSAELTDVSLLVRNARCDGDLSLAGTTVGADVSLAETEVEGDIDLRDLSFRHSSLCVDLEGTAVVSGRLPLQSGVEYSLRGATIGAVNFRADGATLSADRLDLRDADFVGFDFGRHTDMFRQANWNLFADTDEPPSARENTYLRAKNGAAAMGDTAAASEFHYRELNSRGVSHWRRMSAATTVGKTARVAGDWLANRVVKYTCGYGERPSYVVGSSVLIVFVYAAVYTVLGVPTSYRGSAAPLVLSFDAFNALALGLPEVNDPFVGALVGSEAFLGPFFIALFVFTITQSIAR